MCLMHVFIFIFLSLDAAKSSMEEPDGKSHMINTECDFVKPRSKVSVSPVSLCAEDEAPDSEEAAAAAAAVKPAPVPVQRATKSHNASARKRSKPVSASKKRSRNLRP